MKKKIKNIFLNIAVLILLPLITKAAFVKCGIPNENGEIENPCGICDLFQMLADIIGFVMVNLVPVLAALMLAITGFQLFVSASGNPEEMKKAQNSMKNIVLGLVLIYGAWIIINTILSISGLVAWEGLKNGGWGVICN